MNTGKKPKEVLFDSIVIDVYIKPDMSEKERKALRNLLDSKSLVSLFSSVIVGPYRDRIRIKLTK